MTQLCLTPAVKNLLVQLQMAQANSLAPELSMIITPEAQTDTLLARLVEPQYLRMLKARYLGQIMPGLELFSFGLNPLPSDAVLQLGLMPVLSPDGSTSRQPGHHRFEDKLFRVFVLSAHEVFAQYETVTVEWAS